MGADGWAWVGIAAGLVGICGAVIGYAKFMVQAPLVAENAKLEAEKAQVDAARADAERRSERDRERLADIDARYRAIQQDILNLKLGRTNVFIKHEIDTGLLEATETLAVTESSILVPGPLPSSPNFVFLSILGPAAAKLRLAKLRIDSGIVGRVFATGKLHNTTNAYADSSFFRGIDEKGQHETQTMLTVPLFHGERTVGVMQFLNKASGFGEADEVTAMEFAALLAPRVAAFGRDPKNFELLGLAGAPEEKEATILFCDLTSFSALLRQLGSANAIDCINEYFEQQCDIAMDRGATIDKYIGDGVMFRFVASRSRDGNHAVEAVEAALEMCEQFDRLKRGWVSLGLPVTGVFNRVGIASGIVHDARLGHTQRQEITVIGEAVNDAANLCETARRDGNVIVVAEQLVARLEGRFAVRRAEVGTERLRPVEVYR
ncbi:MAG: adenylate/guanylate cyclase domain-containing protein [Solirubrobacterales bacterium]